MKITEKELSTIQEICNFEELQSKHYKTLASFIPESETELKSLFESQSKRHLDNITRLLNYLN